MSYTIYHPDAGKANRWISDNEDNGRSSQMIELAVVERANAHFGEDHFRCCLDLSKVAKLFSAAYSDAGTVLVIGHGDNL